MIIEIITNQTLDPKETSIKVNGVEYKEVKSLQLILAQNNNGTLTIEHGSGYLEAYKSEEQNAK